MRPFELGNEIMCWIREWEKGMASVMCGRVYARLVSLDLIHHPQQRLRIATSGSHYLESRIQVEGVNVGCH